MIHLENILSLIEATLRSTPTVTRFNAIVTKTKDAMPGDLLLAYDTSKESLEYAIEKGVYAIMYEGSVVPLDNETAWIEVPDLQISEYRLLRFHLLSSDVQVFYTHQYTLEYLDQLNNDPDTLIITQPLEKIRSKLWRELRYKRILIPKSDELFLIFPSAKELLFEGNDEITFEPISALESFTYFDNEKMRQKLPWVLAPHFSNALNFIQTTYMTQIPKLSYIPSFDALGISNTLQIKEYGKSHKNIIFIDSLELLEPFSHSIAELTPWIHYKLFFNQSNENFSYNNTIFYKDLAHLLLLLKTTSFEYAIIPFHTRAILPYVETQQPTLFSMENL